MFGSAAFVHIPRENKSSKLGKRSEQCVFLGYGKLNKGYRLWNPVTHKIVHARNVIFNESVSSFQADLSETDVTDKIIPFDIINLESENLDIEPEIEVNNIEPPETHRSTRVRKKTICLANGFFPSQINLSLNL